MRVILGRRRDVKWLQILTGWLIGPIASAWWGIRGCIPTGTHPQNGGMVLLATLCSQLVFTTSFRILFFYIQDTFLGCFKIVPLRY